MFVYLKIFLIFLAVLSSLGLTSRASLAQADGAVDEAFTSPIILSASTNQSGFPKVYAIAEQADGKIIIGGYFSSVAGAPRLNIARLNADGSLDTSFDAGDAVRGNAADNFDTVQSIVIQPDGKIVVAGDFTTSEGAAFNRVVRLHPSGGVDASFNPGAGADAVIQKIKLLPDGKFLVVGNFFNFNNFNHGGIERLNANGSRDTSFNLGFFGLPRPVYGYVAEPQPDGKILLGGFFNQYNNTTRNSIARLLANGYIDIPFKASLISPLMAAAYDIKVLPDGKVFVGGEFQNVNAAVRYGMVRLRRDSTLDPTFNPILNPGAQILSVIPQPDGKVVIGGSFFLNNVFRSVARLNADGTTDFSFAPVQNTLYTAVGQTDGKILVGGPGNSSGGSALVKRYLNTVSRRNSTADFDGDGKTDVSVFRGSNGYWYRRDSSNGAVISIPFGVSTDKLAPADYDGDGKTDIAVFRAGAWYIWQSSNSTVATRQLGAAGDIPLPGDYDGDGRADAAVFSAGTWRILNSASGSTRVEQFGAATDKPVIGNFDGDNRQDLAVFRDGNWYVQRSAAGFIGAAFGAAGDVPVPGDYDADGKTDYAVYRGGNWFVQRSSHGFVGAAFGASSDVPVAADYDGDGKFDFAVYRAGTWFILGTSGGFRAEEFGAATDLPVPAVQQIP